MNEMLFAIKFGANRLCEMATFCFQKKIRFAFILSMDFIIGTQIKTMNINGQSNRHKKMRHLPFVFVKPIENTFKVLRAR